MRVDFHPAAAEEIDASATYYDTVLPGLGERFISEVERVTELIRVRHSVGQPVDKVFRRILLARFPYSMIYSVEADRLWIIAVAHHRRLPGYWRDRDDR